MRLERSSIWWRGRLNWTANQLKVKIYLNYKNERDTRWDTESLLLSKIYGPKLPLSTWPGVTVRDVGEQCRLTPYLLRYRLLCHLALNRIASVKGI